VQQPFVFLQIESAYWFARGGGLGSPVRAHEGSGFCGEPSWTTIMCYCEEVRAHCRSECSWIAGMGLLGDVLE
jgi:hypothetical protein